MSFLDRVRQAVVGQDLENLPRPGGDVGGVPGRALVLSEVSDPYGSDSSGWKNTVIARYVNTDLQLQRLDGDERIVKVRAYVGQRAAQVLRRGMQVPVRVDPQTGAILGLDAEAWEAEAEVVFARESEQGRPAPVPPTATDLRMADDDPALAPIHGVDFETFLALDVAIQQRRLFAPDQQEAHAVAHGVAAGAWAQAAKRWNKRVRKDARLMARHGEAHAAAQADG